MKIVWRGCILLTVGILVYLALRVSSFVHLFFEHAGVALSQDEILQAYESDARHERTEVVPRMIHQIFHNWTNPEDEKVPEDWVRNRQTCVRLNEGWEHKLWTESLSRDFIRENYEWFLPTYSNFQYPVQRIDSLRYFLMRHYGGIYIDLDNACSAPLAPLLYYPAWITDGGHGMLSNNILGSSPNHPYFILLTDSIIPYAWNYPLPYITIMYATGQWFLTAIWQKYHSQLEEGEEVLMRVKMDMREGADPWVFWTQERGGTWNNWDNWYMKWVGDHLVLLGVGIVGMIGIVVGVVWIVGRAFRRRLESRVRGRRGYRLVES